MFSLIIASDVAQMSVWSIFFSELGQCERISDGTGALERLRVMREQGNTCELIILGATLPDMSGREVLRRIRKAEHDAGIHGLDGVKIIMISDRRNTGDILGSFRDGCEAYLIRPLGRQKLVATLTKLGLL